MFNSTKSEDTVNITIIMTNETVLETDEEFFVSLSLAESDVISGVTLEPQNATVSIYEASGEGIVSTLN